MRIQSPSYASEGYCIEPAVVSEWECQTLLASLSGASRTRAGARHLMSHPAVAAVARDERLLQIASAALGRDATPYRATLFEKTGRANWLVAWHQDTALPLAARFDDAGWGPWSQKAGICYAHAPAWALSRVVALRLHLDHSTAENGPLRVIPGSHRAGVLSDASVHDYVQLHKEVTCPVPRAGVLAMSPLLLHCSSKAQIDAPRRVLHIEYGDSLDLCAGVQLAIA